jgi:hypothetical protein
MGEKEGELKKRYKDTTKEGQFKHYIYHNRGNVCSKVYKTCNNDALETDGIFEILNEAKQEYPLESEFLLAIAEKGFEHATFQFLLELHLKRNVWFEHWFGEVSA